MKQRGVKGRGHILVKERNDERTKQMTKVSRLNPINFRSNYLIALCLGLESRSFNHSDHSNKSSNRMAAHRAEEYDTKVDTYYETQNLANVNSKSTSYKRSENVTILYSDNTLILLTIFCTKFWINEARTK